ncbi:MAG: FecR domain-containing protein, partial [Bacteroidota bacterium]
MKNIDRFYELMGRHLTGEISDAERNDLDAWVKADAENQKLFEELTGVWELTEDQASEFQPKAEAAWEKVEARLDDGETSMPSEAKVRSLPSLIRRLGAVAAAAVLLLVAYNWFGQTEDASSPQILAFSTKDGEKLELQLPDGSSIWLNENSHISYEEAFAERTVKLEGEAFFDVERMEDSPFEIISGNARTLVLGTSFNLRAYPDEEEVELTVESGQVKFGERQTKKPIFVPAGESAVLNKETKKAKKVRQKIANATSWKS